MEVGFSPLFVFLFFRTNFKKIKMTYGQHLYAAKTLGSFYIYDRYGRRLCV